MGRKSKYSPEVRERAVRLVIEGPPSHESEWAAISSVAAKNRLHTRDAAEVAAEVSRSTRDSVRASRRPSVTA